MQIKSELLHKFLTKASINGTINQLLIKVEKGTMTACNKTVDNVGIIRAELPITDSSEFVLPIKDSKKLLRIIKLFPNNVDLAINKNILNLFDSKKQIDFTLADESFIDNAVPSLPEKVKFGNEAITVPTDVFKNAIVNKSVISGTTLTIELDGNNLMIETGDEGFDKIKEIMPLKSELKVKTSFNSLLPDVIPILSNVISFNIAKNYPMRIDENDGGVVSTYIIAPFVVNEGSE